eukprot:scaffold50294_cov27-Tisochrysis_lutea.AAC.3
MVTTAWQQHGDRQRPPHDPSANEALKAATGVSPVPRTGHIADDSLDTHAAWVLRARRVCWRHHHECCLGAIRRLHK